MMSYKFSIKDWETCISVLEQLKDSPFENPNNDQFKTLITAIYRQAQKQKKKSNKFANRERDAALIKTTDIISNAQNLTTHFSFIASNNENITHLSKKHYCYCCNNEYTELHFFYHRLCPACATFNYEYRTRDHDFSGYNVVITGGRVKIGYATVLKFLRSGANVLFTTRFPALALEQLKQEADYTQWQNALTVYGLDLRNLLAVDKFIGFCEVHFSSVDILVNNAAQTIKYPEEYYTPLIAQENQLLLLAKASNLLANQTPVVNYQNNLPLPKELEMPLNRFGQPIDNREQNSWNSTIAEIDLEELLEVNLINHISPYRLVAGLKGQMLNSNHAERFIINVTSSEGQFSYRHKTIYHPHTNMTKAALNMLTRTTAPELVRDGIFMTAVDVGWISTGAVESKRSTQFDQLKIPPLDPFDGAMRIVHPIAEVMSGDKSLFGILLKDYKPTIW